ncbi:hypothetical protein TSUD_136690 [Trifolium subterraneum]|uniref:Uncharacterized protein n=1 Tax=Trifolium subterraneum TaxID=3900 RepID=A0A2Z6NVT9_TRISU|nr:hypothetical protein TSUD_136690 [Trifolium subterraneum]
MTYMPMMLPARMQHMHATHLSGLAALHGMSRPNHQMFGKTLGTHLPMPCVPVFSYPGESVMNSSAVGLNPSGTAGLMETVESVSTPKLFDPMPNVNSRVMQNNNGCDSTNQMSIQMQS